MKRRIFWLCLPGAGVEPRPPEKPRFAIDRCSPPECTVLRSQRGIRKLLALREKVQGEGKVRTIGRRD